MYKKKAVVITIFKGKEIERVERESIKLAVEYYKEKSRSLSEEDKPYTKFIIKQLKR